MPAKPEFLSDGANHPSRTIKLVAGDGAGKFGWTLLKWALSRRCGCQNVSFENKVAAASLAATRPSNPMIAFQPSFITRTVVVSSKLLELPLGSFQQVFVWFRLPFRNRPETVVFANVEWAAGMGKKDLQFAIPKTEHQESGALAGHGQQGGWSSEGRQVASNAPAAHDDAFIERL